MYKVSTRSWRVFAESRENVEQLLGDLSDAEVNQATVEHGWLTIERNQVVGFGANIDVTKDFIDDEGCVK